MSASRGAGRLETVRRVAELREAAARAAVGAAGARQDAAERHRAARAEQLEACPAPSGTGGQVQAGQLGTARLADALRDAAAEVQRRDEEHRESLAAWSGAQRRARLLGDVCARHRALHEAAVELRTQHLLDDLAARGGRDRA